MSDAPWLWPVLPAFGRRLLVLWQRVRLPLFMVGLLWLHFYMATVPTVSGIEEVWILFDLCVLYVAKHNLFSALGDWWYVIVHRQNGGKRIIARGNAFIAACLVGIQLGMLGWGALAASRPPSQIIPGALPVQIVSPLIAIYINVLVGAIVLRIAMDRKSLLTIFDIIYRAKPSLEHITPGKD